MRSHRSYQDYVQHQRPRDERAQAERARRVHARARRVFVVHHYTEACVAQGDAVTGCCGVLGLACHLFTFRHSFVFMSS